MMATAFAFIFVGVVLIAGWHDGRFMRIPNIYPLAIIILFLIAHALFGFSPMLWKNLIHFGIALAIGMGLFYFKWIGGGDAKLYAATALWFSTANALLLFILVSLAGGLWAAWLLATRKIKLGSKDPHTKLNRRIPYGVAIALGTVACVAIIGPNALFPELAMAWAR